ncbi:MAG: hypothetical protein OK456_05690, partial [Thaumarchaeota archaeon]|nr:hypothetical protein [Nitrososphaerota archaeon]
MVGEEFDPSNMLEIDGNFLEAYSTSGNWLWTSQWTFPDQFENGTVSVAVSQGGTNAGYIFVATSLFVSL